MTNSTLSLSVVDPTLGTLGITNTFNAADVATIITAFQQQANIAINGTATPQQVLEIMWQGVLQGVLQSVQAWQHQQALAALQPPPLISFT